VYKEIFHNVWLVMILELNFLFSVSYFSFYSVTINHYKSWPLYIFMFQVCFNFLILGSCCIKWLGSVSLHLWFIPMLLFY
jgi:hypothetical protein